MHPLPVLIALLAALLAAPAASAQTPAATPLDRPLMRVVIDQLPPDRIATIGLTRSTFPAGTSLQVVTDSGPALYFVETGALTVTIGEGPSPIVVPAETEDVDATPSATSGGELALGVGDGLLLAPGTTVELGNDGAEPAATLDLITAPDIAVEATGAVTQAVLVRMEATLPEAPATITLARIPLAPGGRLEIPAPPVLSAYAAVERGEAFLLSGQGVNRATEPIEAYVLLIAPAATTGA